jgi:hypothetical protein
MVSAAAHETRIKTLVKEKDKECFRRLGAGAGIAAKLASDAQRGIRGDDADVRRRKEAFGDNAYPKPKPKTFIGHFLEALTDVFLVALLVCAAVSTGFGIKEHGLKDGWYDGVGIFLAVFLVSSVSAAGSYSQSKRADKLARESANIAVTVIRAGRRSDVAIFDVLVGDVVILKIGDPVPADGVFLEGYGLQVGESGMLGEPTGIDVDAQNNPFLAAGEKVVHGHGRMLVTAVGIDTVLGELMNTGENAADDLVPLQERIEEFLTEETTCTNEMSKRPPLKIFAKKDHLRMAARLPTRHVARAANAKAGTPLPPMPNPACCHVAHAGNGGGGTLIFNGLFFCIKQCFKAVYLSSHARVRKYFQRWSLLTFHWCRWSLLSKILLAQAGAGW